MPFLRSRDLLDSAIEEQKVFFLIKPLQSENILGGDGFPVDSSKSFKDLLESLPEQSSYISN